MIGLLGGGLGRAIYSFGSGAALSRVSNLANVVSTRSVRHYGVVALYRYNPLADAGRPTIWYPEDGFDRVEKCTWYIYKGEELKRDQTIKLPFCRTFNEDCSVADLVVSDVLHYSEVLAAQSYPYTQIKKCCKVVSDLTDVTPEKLIGADGKYYYRISYDLVVCTAAVNLKFCLEYNGMEMSSFEANYT